MNRSKAKFKRNGIMRMNYSVNDQIECVYLEFKDNFGRKLNEFALFNP